MTNDNEVAPTHAATHPAYSVYSGECGIDPAPFRIDEGKFAGTVFNYATVKVKDDDGGSIDYKLDFMQIVEDGGSVTKFTSDEVNGEFFETVASPILLNMLAQFVEREASGAVAEPKFVEVDEL